MQHARKLYYALGEVLPITPRFEGEHIKIPIPPPPLVLINDEGALPPAEPQFMETFEFVAAYNNSINDRTLNWFLI